MGINNPIPRSLKAETKKAAKVLASFVKPNQVLGADEVIPPNVLKTARGLAIITVLKAGFLFSGRAGSGVIVARLPDGSWSAPSAIAMAGAGAGGMIGFELTDFVFILNTADAVKSFSQMGSITLGGNISVAAGPLGRNAEAAATASLGGVAAVFAYSKTKGLFAGVSVEGSVIIERRDANRKFYGSNCTANMILSGKVNAPPGADPLFRVLQSRVFNSGRDNGVYANDDDFYADLPSNFESDDISTRERDISRKNSKHSYYDDSDGFDAPWDTRHKGKNASAYSDYPEDMDGFGFTERPRNGDYSGRSDKSRQKSSRWEDDIYDRDIDDVSDRLHKSRISSGDAPSRPTTKKPDLGFSTVSHVSRAPSSNHRAPSSGLPKAVALYTFKGEQKGDLPFRKGEVISILKRSESQDDWWTGKVNGQEGIFPANYVELV